MKTKKLSVDPRQLVSGTITRHWKDLPADAILSTAVLIQVSGVNPKTITRHARAGLLRSSVYVSKRDAERWFRIIEQRGGVRPGRPRKK